MALDNMHLRKLLRILFMDDRQRRAALRSDIRDELAREGEGSDGGGGDFYGPFWADAKRHAFGTVDLHECVDERIAANAYRANLYPQLRDGFLSWWNERRRRTNAPFQPGPILKTRFAFPGLSASVKVDNILSIRDGLGDERFFYPYFAPDPVLSDDAARLGLWLLGAAFPAVAAAQIRMLDVIRGRAFAIDRTPLHGDEEAVFRRLYAAALDERAVLRRTYRD